MRIDDLSKTDFDRAKIKLTGHFDRRTTGRYFEPCETMCNPKDNLVRMIRTMFGIGTIRKCVVSVLVLEVK